MLGKLRFKTSMFEGVLDDGEDSIFISDDKFTKMMETVSGIVEEVEEASNSSDTDAETSASTISIEEEEQPKVSPNEENKETKDENSVTSEDISTNTTEADIPKPTADTEKLRPTEAKTPEGKTGYTNSNSQQTQGAGTSHRPSQPKELVAQGVSFLSGLAETLKSPEATAQLVDSIVEKDEQTGETSIKIPVESKETVSNLLNLIGKLFAK